MIFFLQILLAGFFGFMIGHTIDRMIQMTKQRNAQESTGRERG